MAPTVRAATRRAGAVVPIALGAFVVLGLPDGSIGVAWPSIRAAFGLPLAALGLLSLGVSGGYLVASLFSGTVTARLGTRATVMAAAAAGAVALAVYATAPVWPAIVCFAVLLGLAGGSLDAALNAFVAFRGQPAVMNLLHACYGFGTLAGPLLVTGALLAGASWRPAYGLLAAFEVALLLVVWAHPAGWTVERAASDPAGPAAGGRPFLSRALWLSLVVFFLYTGVEVAAGQWSFSLLTGSRGESSGLAGLLVAAYWAGLTAGRLGAAALSRRLGPGWLLNGSMLLAAAGAGLLWWDPLPALGAAGLPLLGVGLAAVFPALMTLTPARVGRERTASTVGYQLAAANLGGAVLPALAGVVLQGWGLEMLGPYLLAFTALMAVLNLLAGRPAPAAAG